ncbi:MAG TPA: FAD-dependent oxidoreductase [Candidatus Polarisedimenticolaceae bacterium]|nr:FAD-dependent oxidoreductase [Candidatus Polarisedimenticolaceae bacterium]
MKKAVVAGAGVFGVSAAISLSARGFRVDLLDPGPLPRPEAASTDISKIVRLDYGRDDLYVELMERALACWEDWNERWGEELYHPTGFLVLSRGAMSPGGFERDSLETLASRGHAVEPLDAAGIASRYAAWGSRYAQGYFNPRGGWAESGRVVARLLDEARAAGVRVLERAKVASLVETGSRVEGVMTASGERHKADWVVIALGAWTPSLLPELGDRMWAVAQPVFHLRPDDPEAWRMPRFTVWAADIGSTGWYGFPANAAGIVKIANHGPGRRVEPDAPRIVAPGDEARLRAFLAESLPDLAGAPLASAKTCLYCDAFDGDFWIARDPDRPGLAVAAGDSGHGFKFAPVVGDLVADAIEGRASRALDRFAWRAPLERKTEQARFGMS